jgi:hypothetical protein
MDVYVCDEGGALVALIKQTSIVTVLTEGKLKDNPDELSKFFKLWIVIADKLKMEIYSWTSILFRMNIMLKIKLNPGFRTLVILLRPASINLTISNI